MLPLRRYGSYFARQSGKFAAHFYLVSHLQTAEDSTEKHADDDAGEQGMIVGKRGRV